MALTPLDQNVFYKRTEQNFPSGYLTLISIIQGAAISLLAKEVYDDFDIVCLLRNGISSADIVNALFVIMSVGTVITIVHEYIWFNGVFRWMPKVQDSAIPVLLGYFEINAILSLTDPLKWWFWAFCTCAVGVWAYYNSSRNCRNICMEDDKDAQDFIDTSLKKDITLAAVGTLLSLSMFAINFMLYSVDPCTEIVCGGTIKDIANFIGGLLFMIIFYLIVVEGQQMMDNLPNILKERDKCPNSTKAASALGSSGDMIQNSPFPNN